MNSRLHGAIGAVRGAINAASDIPLEAIADDDDLKEDLGLDHLEQLSLALILEEVFAIDVPEGLFNSPLYRTPASLAEWAIRRSDQQAWQEARRAPPGQRRA